MTICLNIALGSRSYAIHIGENLLSDPQLILSQLVIPGAAIVTNETVAPLYLEAVSGPLRQAGVRLTEIVLQDGERYKDWQSLNRIFEALLSDRCERATTLIALGGGVVGDLTGFAAATFLRGVPFIQIPTTLLSQVDSSVGGKTGINHPLGKNMIGAFWQPKRVITDIATLGTLSSREMSAGLAEVIKIALVRDLPFFEWLEANMERLTARDPAALAYAIDRACRNKADVVVGDEYETDKDGGRALLNLGHTFGHAIETGLGYGVWLHGEAVAAGMVMAAELSCRLGWLDTAEVDRVRTLIERAGLPIAGPDLDVKRYLDLMGHDKKVVAGRLRLVLLQGLGRGVTFAGAKPADISASILACRA